MSTRLPLDDEGDAARLSSDFFRDPVWMERVLVSFAGFYFKAIDSYENGRPCPPAWELAFRLADEKSRFVVQDTKSSFE
ncbi:DUF5995 family protein [Metabacillus sediminilitoris]|uniref:DUF5995 family protein n=1 Tax=Metabacillus sediminilitoris TaxID=2567941 RepID=UPI001D0DB6F2|nr:DUF5995 family protein [Metabacillus sediminilitoris]